MSLKFLLKLKKPQFLLSVNLNKNLSFQKNEASNLHTESKDANAEHFKNVAKIYNEFNEVISLGLHNKWRKAIIDNIPVTKDSQILDAAGGTGLNTIKLLEKAKHLQSDSKFQISLIDASPYMLNIAKNDCKKLGYNPKFVKFLEGDLHKLPFDDESFDTVLMSLAIRSSIDVDVVFGEINRVLKTEGKFIVFDACCSKNPTIMQRLFYNYVRYVSATIERIKFGSSSASEYAIHEFRDTLSKIDIQGKMKDANFQNLQFKPVSLGIGGITTGYKL